MPLPCEKITIKGCYCNFCERKDFGRKITKRVLYKTPYGIFCFGCLAWLKANYGWNMNWKQMGIIKEWKSEIKELTNHD